MVIVNCVNSVAVLGKCTKDSCRGTHYTNEGTELTLNE